MPGAVCHSPTIRSDSGYGRGFNKTPLMTLKIATVAPIPSVKVNRLAAAKPGLRHNRREDQHIERALDDICILFAHKTSLPNAPPQNSLAPLDCQDVIIKWKKIALGKIARSFV